MKENNWIGGLFLALVLVFCRFLPLPDNFSPFLALSMFMGYYCYRQWYTLLLPMGAMAVSDLIMGVYPYSGWAFVYIPLLVAAFLGFYVRPKSLSVLKQGTIAAVAFFFISNFGVWFSSGLYPRTAEGLWAAYVAGIPFFHRTLLSTWLYSALIFGLAFVVLGAVRKKATQ